MLPKKNRLRTAREFEYVFKNSKPIFCGNISLRIARRNMNLNDEVRFGFVVSNKVEKIAVRRNGLKRQFRQILRNLISELKSGYDIVVVTRKNFLYPYDQNEIKRQFVEGLKRAGVFKH